MYVCLRLSFLFPYFTNVYLCIDIHTATTTIVTSPIYRTRPFIPQTQPKFDGCNAEVAGNSRYGPITGRTPCKCNTPSRPPMSDTPCWHTTRPMFFTNHFARRLEWLRRHGVIHTLLTLNWAANAEVLHCHYRTSTACVDQPCDCWYFFWSSKASLTTEMKGTTGAPGMFFFLVLFFSLIIVFFWCYNRLYYQQRWRTAATATIMNDDDENGPKSH